MICHSLRINEKVIYFSITVFHWQKSITAEEDGRCHHPRQPDSTCDLAWLNQNASSNTHLHLIVTNVFPVVGKSLVLAVKCTGVSKVSCSENENLIKASIFPGMLSFLDQLNDIVQVVQFQTAVLVFNKWAKM